MLRRKLGGHEEIIVRITAPTNNKDQRNFKLVKTGRRVDVYQIHYGYPYKISLPLKYQADEITFIGLALQSNDKAFINGNSYTEGLYVDNNLHLSNKALYANSLRIRVLDDISFTIDKVYIGSYITKE